MSIPFIVGAYASMPKVPEQRAYYTLLAQEPWISGLEIPFPGPLSDDPASFAEVIAPHWNTCTVTAVPGTMAAISQQPDFGLASPFSEGRAAAVQFTRAIATSIAQLHDALGREVVAKVELQSAPREVGTADDFAQSLVEIAQFDWSGAVPVIEHCDQYIPEQPPEKGFLSLEDEIEVAQATGFDIQINWGRSAIEGRSARTPLDHVISVRDAGVLAGVFFSGAGPKETIYGHPWVDGHMPATSDEPASIMTVDHIQEVTRATLEEPGAASYCGAKICVPPSASLSERIGFIKTIYRAVAGA
ncbi:MAG: DUF4862 family protein [Actinomycetaceae bacterium]|nr:DUF4862 family protein [Actinomycetaceae bacterium]